MKQLLNRNKLLFTLIALLMLAMTPATVCAQNAQAEKKVAIKASSATVESILTEIKKQTGLSFAYSTDVSKSWPKVTMNHQNKSVREILDELMSYIGCEYKISGNVISITKQQLSGKMRVVSGTVRDQDGSPLVGVPVCIGETRVCTVTDDEGGYSLKVPVEKTTLKFTYVGMETTYLTIGAGTSNAHKDVMMHSDNLLNDVMVTGYQQLSRERATGAFDKIGKDVLSARPTADISAALQGLVAGMQATEKEDGTMDFQIRGTSSLYANTQPLIVVDGFPIEGTFNSINPNDVESVTVLKDAAAASIWGARSANGVIVVTTKKGSAKKLNVEVQAFTRIGFTPDIDYITNQADSRTTVDYELRALKNGWDMGYGYFPSIDNLYGTGLSLVMEEYFANQYYGLSENQMNANLEKLRNTSNRQQLKDLLMQTAVLQQYNANISGGNDRMNNYFSIMYEKNDEATIKRGYERFMLNYNNIYKFNKHITGTAAVTLQKRNQETSGVTVSSFADLSPYELLLNEDGSYAHQCYSYNKFELENIDASKFPYSDFNYNLLQDVRNRSYKSEQTKYRVQLGLNAKIIKGLEYDMKYQYERNESKDTNKEGEETFYVRNTINYLTDFNPVTGAVGSSCLPAGAILHNSSAVNYNQVFRNQLSYNNVFDKHDISVLVGMEASQYVTNSTRDAYIYGYNEKTNTAPVLQNGASASPQGLDGYAAYYWPSTYYLNPSFSERTDRFVSYFGNAAYIYDNKYGVSFSARSDGSNFISKDKSLRWSPMWSVGGKWIISNEKFMKDTDWVNYLNVRLTYGLNGNAEKSTSPETLISISNNATIKGNMATVASYGNPGLKWETTKTVNFGVDFSLFNNILSGKVDYYSRKSVDVIGQIAIPSAYGSLTQRFNNAEISNHGIEIELNARHTFKEIGLGVNSTLTFSYNKNEITNLYNPSLYCYELVQGTFVEGKPLGALYSYEFAGTKEGIPYVKGVDGEPSSMNDLNLHNNIVGIDILKYSGTTIAPYTLGWANSFSWKGLSLYVFITGKFGSIFRVPGPTIPVVGSSKPYVNAQVSDIAASDGTQIPTWPNKDEFYMYRWNRYLEALDYYVESGDFIKLKEISLSYQLPSSILRAVKLKTAKVFCQMQNLGCIYTANKYGYDPEWVPGTNKPAGNITFGVNINL